MSAIFASCDPSDCPPSLNRQKKNLSGDRESANCDGQQRMLDLVSAEVLGGLMTGRFIAPLGLDGAPICGCPRRTMFSLVQVRSKTLAGLLFSGEFGGHEVAIRCRATAIITHRRQRTMQHGNLAQFRRDPQ